MRLERIGSMSREQWDALIDGEEDPFGVADEPPKEWKSKQHFTLLYDGERPVAAAGLLVVPTDHGDVVGVGGVIVTRTHRRQGHLRPVLEDALERATTLGPDTAMLFCSEQNLGLYARFGFAEIAAPVVVDQPGGETMTMPPHAMWRPLRAGATWRDGPVRVQGLPF
jgi:hypothetical protein